MSADEQQIDPLYSNWHKYLLSYCILTQPSYQV